MAPWPKSQRRRAGSETPDGREVYFHANSVLEEAFGRLDVGAAVTFVEEEGDKGPQASTVRLLGKHHYA